MKQGKGLYGDLKPERKKATNRTEQNHYGPEYRLQSGADLQKTEGGAIIPTSILYKSTAGRYRPVSYPDGPITAGCRFVKNPYWN